MSLKSYPIPAGNLTNSTQFVGAGQVLYATAGLNLAGVALYIDSLGAAPIFWPQGVAALDLGCQFQQFWLVGNVASGGNLLVGGHGFRPFIDATNDPLGVNLLQGGIGSKSPVVLGDDGSQTAIVMVGTAGPGAGSVYPLRALIADGVGGIPGVALAGGAGTVGAAALSDASYDWGIGQGQPIAGVLAAAGICVVGGSYSISIGPGVTDFIWNPNQGSSGNYAFRRAIMQLDTSGGAAFNLIWAQRQFPNGPGGQDFPFFTNTFCSGAAGAAIPAGQYTFLCENGQIISIGPAAAPDVLTPIPLGPGIAIQAKNVSAADAQLNFAIQLFTN